MAAPRVLVVDDEPVLLDAYARLLSRNGYEVVSSGKALQALEIVRSGPPVDVLLSDVIIPDMRGTELIREVALISPETRCLLMTAGYVDLNEVPDEVPLLRKPLLTRDLIAAVDQAIARSAELSSRLRENRKHSGELQREGMRLRKEFAEAVRDSREVISEIRLNREEQSRRERDAAAVNPILGARPIPRQKEPSPEPEPTVDVPATEPPE
jgi:DNA-binding NtrC family response regulator